MRDLVLCYQIKQFVCVAPYILFTKTRMSMKVLMRLYPVALVTDAYETIPKISKK